MRINAQRYSVRNTHMMLCVKDKAMIMQQGASLLNGRVTGREFYDSEPEVRFQPIMDLE